jgi:hypothetical protein
MIAVRIFHVKNKREKVKQQISASFFFLHAQLLPISDYQTG